MTPSEIKPGMKFGHWEVIKFDHTNVHRIKYFLCKCEIPYHITSTKKIVLTFINFLLQNQNLRNHHFETT